MSLHFTEYSIKRGDLGTVTIVTDNQPYGESLIRALAKTAQQVLSNRSSRSSGSGSGSSGSGNNNKDGSSGNNSDMAFVSAKVSASDGISKRTLQESIAVMENGTDSSSVTGKSGEGIGGEETTGKSAGKQSGKKSLLMQAASSMDVEDCDEDDDDEDDDEEDDKRDRKKSKTTARTAARTIGSIDTKGDLRLELWRGDSEEGSGSRSSSYFDRLWERGQKKRRWFIVLRKL